MSPPSELLDLRGTPCPINFIRTKLKLAQLPPAEPLDVWLDGGEPVEQVPESLRAEGYCIESIEAADGYYVVRVSRPVVAES